VPGIAVLRSYQRSSLPRDLIAGLVLTTLLVPQGMAYAELAGLPTITGLYTTMLCLVAYAIFGPSRILVLGPDSSLGPMIAASILPLIAANGDPEQAVALASMLAIIVGVITIGVGIARLGFVADLLSKPAQIGYLTGLAATIFIGQLPKLFGFSTDADGFIPEIRAFLHGVADGKTVPAALILGVSGMVLILALQHWLPTVPSLLVTVIASIVVVWAFSLADHGVSVVGVLPRGLPVPTLPDVSWSDLPPLLGGAAGIALVALTDTISTSTAFAAKRKDVVDSNQEMIGIGAANVAAGLFQGFPVSTSGSRTAVAERAGARTQVTGLVGAALVALMLVLVPGLLRNLAQPILAAIVITASMSLADVPGLHRLWRVRRMEFWVALVAVLGVALLGVLAGIGIAVGLSILNVFRRAWWPYSTTLGEVPELDGLHDVHSYPDAFTPPGVLIYRFDAPLIFANSRSFTETIRGLLRESAGIHHLIVAAGAINDIDITAADTIAGLAQELRAQGVAMDFAELKDPVRSKLRRGVPNIDELTRFYPTIESAIEATAAV